jgi:hypothetical protein
LGAPDIHVHAFSPLEVTQGAQTLGWPLRRYLEALRDAGLGSLPGTAAEILDDEVRAVICPDKLSTASWLQARRFDSRADPDTAVAWHMLFLSLRGCFMGQAMTGLHPRRNRV